MVVEGCAMIKIWLEEDHGIWTANYESGWSMATTKEKAINGARKTLMKLHGYKESDFMIVDIDLSEVK